MSLFFVVLLWVIVVIVVLGCSFVCSLLYAVVPSYVLFRAAVTCSFSAVVIVVVTVAVLVFVFCLLSWLLLLCVIAFVTHTVVSCRVS